MIHCEIRDHIAVVTLDNPSANTFTLPGLVRLRELVGELNANRQIYALVITGKGEKFFSAGADLKGFSGSDKWAARSMIQAFGDAFAALQDARPVVIAAINGYALGGALECALACDIRIAEEHAQMGLPETAVGLLAGAGGTQALAWLVGEGWAKRIILTNERIDAQTAERIGLVQQVVPRGESLSVALAMAERVTALSPQAISASKELIHLARQGVPRAAAMSVERERFMSLFDGADRQEGIDAFFAKRKPEWNNA